MKRVLITGGGGFAGSHLIELLQNADAYDIHATSFSDTSPLEKLLPNTNIHAIDLTDLAKTAMLMEEVHPEIIFHLASISSVHKSEEVGQKILTENIALQYSVLSAIKSHSPQARFVAICSADAYGASSSGTPLTEDAPLRPTNPYSLSKVAQEYLTQKYHLVDGLDTIILRSFNHTGERQTADFVVPAFAKQIAAIEAGRAAPQIRVGNLETVRDFTDVKDMVRAYMLASERGTSGEVYNVGSGTGVKIRTILDTLISLSRKRIEVVIDKSLYRKADTPTLVADYSKFALATSWKPQITLDQTLKRVLNYWRGEIK